MVFVPQLVAIPTGYILRLYLMRIAASAAAFLRQAIWMFDARRFSGVSERVVKSGG
jgi:hypothetical protein